MLAEIKEIDEQKKVGCWVWPVLVIGSLLFIWGFCIGSIAIYGQISGTSGTGQTFSAFLIGLSFIALLPLVIGSGMLGISIYTLLIKSKQPSSLQSALGTINLRALQAIADQPKAPSQPCQLTQTLYLPPMFKGYRYQKS